jgi:hypothetical protein
MAGVTRERSPRTEEQSTVIEDPDVAALRTDLESVGIVVAPHRDHLCVRLPLFAADRVRVDDDGRLSCEPMFGPLPRTRALLLNTTLFTAAAIGLLYFTGLSPLSIGVAFVGLMSGVTSVCRFVLTESCITRVQMLWAARHEHAGRSTFPPASTTTLRALDPPAPDGDVVHSLRNPIHAQGGIAGLNIGRAGIFMEKKQTTALIIRCY